jgi:uncharacterized protein (DUF736 family)
MDLVLGRGVATVFRVQSLRASDIAEGTARNSLERQDWPQPRRLRWLNLTDGRLRLDRPDRNGAGRLSSPALNAHSSRDKKVARRRPSLRCGPTAAASTAPGPPIAIEAAMVAARATQGDQTMATIGTFTKSGSDYTGSVKTLTVNVKTKIAAAEKDSDKAPDFRIFAGATEFGAAWKKTSKAEREYLSVKLDDPSFPAPIYASLVEAEDGQSFNLIWSRRNGE